MNINDYLKEWAEKDDWIDQKFADAFRGDSIEAMRIWAEIADGTASIPSTLLWAQHVAKMIVPIFASTSKTQANRRPDEALKAIGFRGQRDAHRDAKEFMKIFLSFNAHDDQGNELPTKALSGREWVKLLKSRGYLDGMDENTAVKRANEWLKDFGKN